MIRLLLVKKTCSLFPPFIAQYIRNKLSSKDSFIKKNIDFKRKSITGSLFQGNSIDYHCYPYYFHGYFDWRNVVLANVILKIKTGDIVEIGANIGTETISYCDITKEKGNVYAFEPLVQNFNKLNQLKETQENLVLINKALSNKNGIAVFKVPKSTASGMGKIIPSEFRSNLDIEVEIIKLDDYYNTIANSRLIVIDTEGHEKQVLEGAIKIITSYKPIVILEVSLKLLVKYGKSSSREIFDFFKTKNYSVYIINRFSIKKVSEIEIQSKKAANWICVPSHLIFNISMINKELFKRAILPWYLLSPLCK